MTAEVRIEIDGAVATVTECRGARFNAMSLAMWQQLRAAFQRIDRVAALRCVVVRGAHGRFYAGGDIAEYRGFRFGAPIARLGFPTAPRELALVLLEANASDYTDAPERREGVTAFLDKRDPRF